MKTIPRLVCGVSILCALCVGELLARPRTFVAGDRVRFKIDVPPGYSFKTETAPDGQVVVKLENPVWPINIAAVIAPASLVSAGTEEAQRNLLVQETAEILAQSKEQDYRFVALNPARGTGVYCLFSDPNVRPPETLGPNEYLHILAGIKTIPGAVMYFRIMCNDVTSPEFQEAMGLFVDYFHEA